ncbi:MAG TPA: non-homologous end-joining DNA ligase, partial [Polyangiaceae bacterium LLY-WYZ-14_1]|nr:non-homologous end-joining DNA ligase [Polyangiaceae bacterium LLY-WYZ-14_1]
MATRRYGEITVETSKEDKRLFPEADLRKIDVIDYYERIANLMLPHLEGRPVVLERFPDGIAEDGFYQKQAGQHFPDFIPRVEVALRGEARRQKLVRCEDVATLVYLANQGTISFHPWGSRIESLDQPDRIIVDLDPPEGGPFAAVRTAALRTRELFVALGLRPYVKLTGSKGVHVVAALDGEATFDAVRGLAQDAAELLAERHPDALTTAHRKDRRGERLYLDVARNAYGQTAVAPWSLR